MKGIFYGHLKQNCPLHCSFRTALITSSRIAKNFITKRMLNAALLLRAKAQRDILFEQRVKIGKLCDNRITCCAIACDFIASKVPTFSSYVKIFTLRSFLYICDHNALHKIQFKNPNSSNFTRKKKHSQIPRKPAM